MSKTHIKGWGHFNTEEELLATIDAEIGTQRRQVERLRSEDVEAVAWMREDLDASDGEIMETLGISRANLRRIQRLLDTETTEGGVKWKG